MIRNTLLFILFFLSLSSCEKEDVSTRRNPYGNGAISEEQKNLQNIFKSIMNDSDSLATNHGSLNLFLIDTIVCQEAENSNCEILYFSYDDIGFNIDSGDTVELANSRLIFKNSSDSLLQAHTFGVFGGTPIDFPYLEFGIFKNNEMANCCYTSSINLIDTTNKVIEFKFPRIGGATHLVKMTAIE